ncbi:MAG: hypothetical protein GSR78_00745 [Desulfurococcales archaeon]|nr:hypothetical protein [Desulfurococcales archaeon]
MKLLHLHAGEFMYRTREKALKKTPDPPGSYECTGSCLVTFITVEDGDSVYTVDVAARDILDIASRVKAEEIILYPYAHLSPRLAPPRTAHRILALLEEQIKKETDKPVHRSPFGWYKEFKIHVLGHPLSELSRTIEEEAVYKPGSDKLKEKYNATLSQPRLSKDAEASAERLGFKPITARTQAILLGLLSRSHGAGIESWEVKSPRSRLTLLLRSCRDNTAYITREGPIIPRDARSLGLEEPEDNIAVEPIGENGFAYPGLETGEVYLYNTGETLIPYKAHAGDRECIDAWSLALALIDERVKKALAGGPPPMLPWPLAPVHYTVIPVAEGQKRVAEEIAERIASLGLRTMLLDDTNTRLGARIRNAGKMWSMITLVIGEKEAADGVAVVRRRWEPGRQEAMKIEEIIDEAIAYARSLYGLKPLRQGP